MPIQKATTEQLDQAQRVVVSRCRYTAEHNAPMTGLVEHFRLGKGEKSITVPKAAQMNALHLSDGVDIGSDEDIGMTVTDLTTAEVGLKVILTDKLVRQLNEDAFGIVGNQAGKAMGRIKDTDILALFSALNGGTDWGANTRDLELGNLLVLRGQAKAAKFDDPVVLVHHPITTMHVGLSTAGYVGSGTMGTSAGSAFPADFSQDLLNKFFEFRCGQLSVFQDGNITVTSDNAVGAIFAPGAMCFVESVGYNTERERDASLRATELVTTADYGVFELDDSQGAPVTMNASEATD